MHMSGQQEEVYGLCLNICREVPGLEVKECAVWTSSKALSYCVCMKPLRAYTQLVDPAVASNKNDKAERMGGSA